MKRYYVLSIKVNNCKSEKVEFLNIPYLQLGKLFLQLAYNLNHFWYYAILPLISSHL